MDDGAPRVPLPDRKSKRCVTCDRLTLHDPEPPPANPRSRLEAHVTWVCMACGTNNGAH
jgi:hypothetical protein